MSRSPHSPYEERRGKRDLTILRIADVHRRPRRRPKAGARLGGVKRVLVVDDAPTVSEVVAGYLDRAGFAVDAAGDGPAAVARSAAQPPTLWCRT